MTRCDSCIIRPSPPPLSPAPPSVRYDHEAKHHFTAHDTVRLVQYAILLVIVRERVAFFVKRAKNEQAAKAVIYIKVSGAWADGIS
jgi:hypothetical protein